MKREKWWKDKVIYQIYPKSFNDSNDDGIGDLKGIIEKIDYLKGLGVDILWLSPCFKSPFADQGYDISDYYEIDPQFGSIEDMERLIEEAKKRDMYILLDLVVNHCSDEHEWFKQACEDPDGRYGKYFYIRDRLSDGNVPTNWRSYFGGSVWSELPGHPDKVYFHAFHEKQPDLNWENPEVRTEIYKMICWWLEKGIAGFRIDAIRNIRKPKVFENYTPDGEDGLCSIDRMIENAQDIGEFLKEMRRETFDKYDAFTVAEVSGDVTDELDAYVGENGYFSSIFDFREIELSFRDGETGRKQDITAEEYKQACFISQHEFAKCGTAVNVIENHDGPRGVNRFIKEGEVCLESKKMLGALNYFMKGIPCIYQGQELGMENLKFKSPEEFKDISDKFRFENAISQGYDEKRAVELTAKMSRDNGRMPMAWNDSIYGGFSHVKPWMTVIDNYDELNVQTETEDSNSVLNFYKRMAELRNNPVYKKCFIDGEFIPKWRLKQNLMAYIRKANREIMVIGNYKNSPDRIVLEAPYTAILLNNYEDDPNDIINIDLKPYQLLVMEV